MNEIGLAAAHYAERAVAALQVGDMATAIGYLASIDQRSWEALQARLPGFPSPGHVAALSAVWRDVESAARDLPQPPNMLTGLVDHVGRIDVIA